MDSTRRAFIQQAAVLGLVLPQGMRGQSSPPAIDLWDLQASHSFGITQNGSLLDPVSAYKADAKVVDRFSFDISNNQILCAVNRSGLLSRAIIQTGIVPNEAAATPVGAYVDKVLVRGGPWPIALRLTGQDAVRLDELPPPNASLYANLFPLFDWTHRGIRIRMLAFVPAGSGTDAAPRMIVAWIGLKNITEAAVSGGVTVPGTKGAEAIFLLNDNRWAAAPGEWSFSLGAGASGEVSLGFALGSEAGARMRNRSASQLLGQTANYHSSRYGRLTIPESPYFADLFQRAGELARQSILQLPGGEFGGSFNGSEVADNSTVWMKDCFYACLPQSFLDPSLCAAAILFFLKWGMPSRLLGPSIARFPGASPVTNSLGNSVSALVLAGSYYQMTGEASFFLRHPEILTRGEEVLNAVLASRRGAPFVFPSLYVSDGDARGDFHTGSNVAAWRAFRAMSRLAKEVYNSPALADAWESIAAEIYEAIWSHCTAMGSHGKQFVEGAMADESSFRLHDGEESDATLMPFYGFCASDEPAYLNHAQLGMTRENPYFFERGEGIWWYAHGKWSSATFQVG